jgi:hypothetical protein
MANAKKKLSVVLGCIVVIVVCIVIYQQYVLNSLMAKLQEQVDLISAGYISLMDETIVSLQKQHNFTQAQDRLTERTIETREKLKTAETLEEKIQQIGMLQAGLINFTESAANDPAISKEESFLHLQHEMGETGDVRALLKEYNTTAQKWNGTLQSSMGALTADILNSDRNLLPYLRFNGDQEFVPVIRM